MARKKFKRHFTGSDARRRNPNPGKGSDQRESQVSDQELQENWCLTFGHKMAETSDICDNCGKRPVKGDIINIYN